MDNFFHWSRRHYIVHMKIYYVWRPKNNTCFHAGAWRKIFLTRWLDFFSLSVCVPKTLISVHWNPVVLFYDQSTLLKGLLNRTNSLNCLTRAVASLWNIYLNLHNVNKTNNPLSSFVVSYFNFIFSIEKDDFSKKVQFYLCSKKM